MKLPVWLLTLALPLLAQPIFAQHDPVKGRQVVEEAIQALGGNAFTSMADRVERGRAYSFYRQQLSGLSKAVIYTRYLVAPNPPQPSFLGQRERQAFGKKEDVYIVFNEMGGHEITYRGARPLPKDTIERWKESLFHNILYTLRMRLNEPGLVFEFTGTERYENQPVNVVDVVDSENRVVTVYFQQSTKLPVWQRWVRRDPRSREQIEEISVFAKFRDTGNGAQWPYVVRRERNGEKIFEMFADEILVNQNLTDDMFTLPGDLKILPPIGSKK